MATDFDSTKYVAHDVYFAGPLFNEAENTFNLQLTQKIEQELGLTVFLPWRDGYEAAKLRDLPEERKNAAIFDLDRWQVLHSRIFVFNLDGMAPDPGACTEVGFAFAQREQHRQVLQRLGSETLRKLDEGNFSERYIVGIKTDARGLLPGVDLNPLPRGCLDFVAKTGDQLVRAIGEHAPLVVQ